jgi:tight adherence protein C
MLLTLTAVVFVLVATTSAALVLGFNRRPLGVERLAAVGANAAQRRHSAASRWREWVGRIGAALPVPQQDLPELKRRLGRAGFRNDGAIRYFQGIRWLSTVVFAACGVAAVWQSHSGAGHRLFAAAAAGAFGFMAPSQALLFQIRARQKAIARALPNALDLMVICVESGLGIDQTMLQVVQELRSAYPELSSELTIMNLELRAGERRATALHNLAERIAVEDVRKLVAVLVQTDRFGTSIAQCLRGHAEYLRAMTRQRAEERASKLAVKLVFPIFFCILPSLFVVTIGPVMTHLVRDLLPMIENI